ncbi:hypothetical protein GCM10008020_16470 [Massilia psychrophila]|jgi:hypothetical protein|nr:hypothetical protein GCM10008020_16470 [Massilia psychrophila]
MPSSCQLIFRVSFEHAFFADGTLRCLRIEPSAACHNLLRRAGVLLRAQDDGIAAFGDGEVVERLRLHVAEAGAPLNMAFLVFFTDVHFFEYTVPAWPKGQLLLLDTARSVPDDAGRQVLHVTPYVSASAFIERDHADLEPILGKPFLAPAPAMVLQVAVSSDLLTALDARQRHFYSRFDAASSHWKYCLFGAGEAQAAIVDLAGDMEFDHCTGVEIGGHRGADVFLSKRAIAMREVCGARFQLRAASPAGDKVLIKRMPNASVGKHFRESKDGNQILVSEIFINQ